MRATSKLLAIALAALVQPAFAALEPVTIDFEKISLDLDPWGMVALASNNPYAELGVAFTGDAWGVLSNARGCGGFSSFAPIGGSGCGALLLASNPKAEDPAAIGVAAATQSPSFTINFAEGFVAGSSLSYKALVSSNVRIELFSGLDGVGSLGTVDGLAAGKCGIAAVEFCDWGDPLTLNFGGVAKSMVVTGGDELFMLDNLSFARQDASVPGQLPEPASLALALSALGVLGWSRKRAGAR